MNERFSVLLMLSLSFTEQVKAIYCSNALVCVIITRPRSHEGSFALLLAIDLLYSVHFSCHFHHQFPDFLGSPASVKFILDPSESALG